MTQSKEIAWMTLRSRYWEWKKGSKAIKNMFSALTSTFSRSQKSIAIVLALSRIVRKRCSQFDALVAISTSSRLSDRWWREWCESEGENRFSFFLKRWFSWIFYGFCLKALKLDTRDVEGWLQVGCFFCFVGDFFLFCKIWGNFQFF